MAAASYDITIEQGSTFSKQLTYKVNTVGVNLSTAVISGMIRKYYDDTVPLVSFTITAVTLASGIFKIELSDTQTALLDGTNLPIHLAPNTVKIGFYDIVVELSSNDVRRIMQGVVYLSLEATK